MLLQNTKSLRKCEISKEEIYKLIEKSNIDKELLEYHIDYDEENEWGCDTLICIGDLTIDGNFELGDKVNNLIVTGNLTVNGLLEHYDDEPITFLFVGGNFKAKNLITGGTLEVLGNVEIEGALIGHYNDCSAIIQGNAKAEFFYPEEHFFEINGIINFEKAYGNTWRVNEKKNNIDFMSDRAFYDLVDHAILNEPVTDEQIEEDEMVEMDDYYDTINDNEWYDRLREGKSFYKEI